MQNGAIYALNLNYRFTPLEKSKQLNSNSTLFWEVKLWERSTSTAQSAREMETKSSSSSNSVTIIHNAMIVTMDPESRVFKNGGIVIEQDKIKAIGQSSDILSQFSSVAHHLQIIDLHSHILLPGTPSLPPSLTLLLLIYLYW